MPQSLSVCRTVYLGRLEGITESHLLWFGTSAEKEQDVKFVNFPVSWTSRKEINYSRAVLSGGKINQGMQKQEDCQKVTELDYDYF